MLFTKPVISVPLPFAYATLSPFVNVLDITILLLANTTTEGLLPLIVTDGGGVRFIAAPPDVADSFKLFVAAETTK